MKLEKYQDTWPTSLANELGRLVQGIRDVPGTNTIFLILKSDIPKDRRKEVTYVQIVVSYRPQKTEKNKSRLVVGGDRLMCLFDVITPTCDLPTIKILWNYVLSTPGDMFFTLYLENFYIGTPMALAQYMRLPIKIIPQEIIDIYNLNDIVEDGWVYVKIVKGMYGLPEAVKKSNDLFKKLLDEAGYYPIQFTTEMWRHVWRPITFTLVVDDFGIKFEGDIHANHLVKTLIKRYNVTTDWKGGLFVVIKLKWDYKKLTLYIRIPTFIPTALHKYQHPKPTKPQHVPVKAVHIQYGAKIQVEKKDKSPGISESIIKLIQDVVGTFACYGRAVDPKMAATLRSIASRQSKATENLEEELKTFGLLCNSPKCRCEVSCKLHDTGNAFSVNSCVPKTVRHGTSLHRICPKLSIDSSPSRLESQASVLRLTEKLFCSSHIRLESQAYVR